MSQREDDTTKLKQPARGRAAPREILEAEAIGCHPSDKPGQLVLATSQGSVGAAQPQPNRFLRLHETRRMVAGPAQRTEQDRSPQGQHQKWSMLNKKKVFLALPAEGQRHRWRDKQQVFLHRLLAFS